MSGKAGNVKNGFRNNWKVIALGLAPVVILVIIFALPLKIVPIQTTETYMDTELQQQPYTDIETYEESEPYVTTETMSRTVYDSTVSSSGWSYSFTVDQPGTTVNISTSGGTYYNPYYYQPFYIITDNVTPYPPYFPYFNNYYWWGDPGYSGRTKVTIQVSYPEEVTRYRTVTKTREVTRYHEVPVEVEKERTTTKWVQMSIWQYLFLDQRQKADLPEAQMGG
jgi:hypothetical protein